MAGAVFLIMINQGMLGMLAVITTFIVEKQIIIREYEAGLYSSVSYYMSKTFVDLPYQLLNPIIFTSIFWYMAGINDDPKAFFTAMGFVLLVTLGACSVGYAIGAISSSVTTDEFIRIYSYSSDQSLCLCPIRCCFTYFRWVSGLHWVPPFCCRRSSRRAS
eukprot:GHVU01035050.1.p1 GENE.GHVU01035050.1~~GHVU01035050.1.p1  ORF type:complete len:161 (-),score=14.66 GHVU01035050.1:257-739(-)